MELKRIDVEQLLNDMSLSQYRRWLTYIARNGLTHRNQERLLQQLNAGVLNASGRWASPVLAQDFDWRREHEREPQALSQVVLTQLLCERASIRAPDHEG
ncbi:hypothetical protein OH456_06695 [Vibrio sp. La 4.2.2]|uniref:hypothetical protein n=1 Tax=Vibrio sp. La 4.2.2 TaxID=2998830 RepID=UPI0022CDDE84|nr:hypothetical protein [Vibrio sp. La 4.2.2]MDA0107823.1 hypothetical protein [Vibrio sp. La 4.2.2]